MGEKYTTINKKEDRKTWFTEVEMLEKRVVKLEEQVKTLKEKNEITIEYGINPMNRNLKDWDNFIRRLIYGKPSTPLEKRLEEEKNIKR